MKMINGSICAAKGFLTAGVYAGLKRNPHKKDIAVIYSQRPAVAAGVLTTNQVKAAPVILTRQRLQADSTLQAIVINSGNANACTGWQGLQDAQAMVDVTAQALQLSGSAVAVASTGVIGVPLPMAKITAGILAAVQQLTEDDESAAQAILTTDTFTKTRAVEGILSGKTVRLGGMAKGSGMIHPMMATMLAFITTDIAISQAALQQALRQVNEDSFHMISVDGDSSTNDMVLILANGMAGNSEITGESHPDWPEFCRMLTLVCQDLARQIAKDGEGASKLIEMTVKGAADKPQARLAARAVCRSPLVKSAVFGQDANWGRIASALGASGVMLNSQQLSITLGDSLLFQQGRPLAFDEILARQYLQQETVKISADLGMGTGQAVAWGCDLTPKYIEINASYRS